MLSQPGRRSPPTGRGPPSGAAGVCYSLSQPLVLFSSVPRPLFPASQDGATSALSTTSPLGPGVLLLAVLAVGTVYNMPQEAAANWAAGQCDTSGSASLTPGCMSCTEAHASAQLHGLLAWISCIHTGWRCPESAPGFRHSPQPCHPTSFPGLLFIPLPLHPPLVLRPPIPMWDWLRSPGPAWPLVLGCGQGHSGSLAVPGLGPEQSMPTSRSTRRQTRPTKNCSRRRLRWPQLLRWTSCTPESASLKGETQDLTQISWIPRVGGNSGPGE